MPVAEIDQTELLRRRNHALARLEELKAELRRVAYAAETGDKTAANRLSEIEDAIVEQEKRFRRASVAAEGLQQIQADERQAAAERRRQEHLEHQRQLQARDRELQHAEAQSLGRAEKIIGELVEAMKEARVLGVERDAIDNQLSTVEAALGRPRSVGLSFKLPRQSQHSVDIINRCMRRLTDVTGAVSPNIQMGAHPLAVEVPPVTLEQPPDRFTPRRYGGTPPGTVLVQEVPQ